MASLCSGVERSPANQGEGCGSDLDRGAAEHSRESSDVKAESSPVTAGTVLLHSGSPGALHQQQQQQQQQHQQTAGCVVYDVNVRTLPSQPGSPASPYHHQPPTTDTDKHVLPISTAAPAAGDLDPPIDNPSDLLKTILTRSMVAGELSRPASSPVSAAPSPGRPPVLVQTTPAPGSDPGPGPAQYSTTDRMAPVPASTSPANSSTFFEYKDYKASPPPPIQPTGTPHSMGQTPQSISQTAHSISQTPHSISQTPNSISQTPPQYADYNVKVEYERTECAAGTKLGTLPNGATDDKDRPPTLPPPPPLTPSVSEAVYLSSQTEGTTPAAYSQAARLQQAVYQTGDDPGQQAAAVPFMTYQYAGQELPATSYPAQAFLDPIYSPYPQTFAPSSYSVNPATPYGTVPTGSHGRSSASPAELPLAVDGSQGGVAWAGSFYSPGDGTSYAQPAPPQAAPKYTTYNVESTEPGATVSTANPGTPLYSLLETFPRHQQPQQQPQTAGQGLNPYSTGAGTFSPAVPPLDTQQQQQQAGTGGGSTGAAAVSSISSLLLKPSGSNGTPGKNGIQS